VIITSSIGSFRAALLDDAPIEIQAAPDASCQQSAQHSTAPQKTTVSYVYHC